MVGVPAWCSRVMCKRGWRTKVDSVGDIGGNIGCELDSVMGSALFLKFLPKTAENKYCSKLEIEFRFRVIYTSNIFYFLEFPLDI